MAEVQTLNFSPREKARKKWKLIKNTIRAISLFRTHETHTMYDVEDLIEEIKLSPTKEIIKRQPSLVAESIDEHKLREKLFGCIKTSTPEDLEKIKEIIENNPKRYTVSNSSPESLINKPLLSYRPIFEAAKLGYVETVDMLLKFGADPHLKNGNKYKENSLDVACRWRHHAVVIVLLENSEWSDTELRKAIKNTSAGIETAVKDQIKGAKEEGCHCHIF